MSSKGTIRFFAIALAIICLRQLSFTWISQHVENQAEEYAQGDFSKKVFYLDSVRLKPAIDFGFFNITYQRAKSNEMNLGLDLKGGINVTLQVSVKEILRKLTNNTEDRVFNTALNSASNLQKNSSEKFITLFFSEFDRINAENGNISSLASPNVFATKDLSDEITINSSDEEVQKVISKKVDDAVKNAFIVLRARIDKFGVAQPNIQRIGSSGRILVELPGVKDIDRVKKLLVSTAQLEFWHVYNLDEIWSYIIQGDKRIKPIIEARNKATLSVKDSLEDKEKKNLEGKLDKGLLEQVKEAKKTDSIPELNLGPIQKLINKGRLGYSGRPEIFYARVQDTALINKYMSMRQFREVLPTNLKYTKFLWGKEEQQNDVDNATKGFIPLYAVKSNRKDEAPLSGDVITNAKQDYDSNSSSPIVSMQMNSQGAKIWEKMTTEAFNSKTSIAIALDEIVYSAPGVSNGPISGGNSQISGNFTINESQDLATKLNAGKLPAPANIIQAEVIGPSLGKKSIDSGLKSFIIALIVVLLWMLFYYSLGGLYADFALLINLLFVFGVLASLHAVLTLPGIAGIVLTIGISVDANVLIFERIKEELAKGKVIKQAIKDGYRHAYSAIIDANVTTMFTGIILFVFGTGPIRGFATTLIIGIITSLFCAIFIARLFIDFHLEKRKKLEFFTNITKGWFVNWKISFLKYRKFSYVLSGLLIIISVFSLLTRGLNQGVDFVGGRSYVVLFEKEVSPEDLIQSLGHQFVDESGNTILPEVKTFGSNNQVKITTKYKIESEDSEVNKEIESLLYKGLQTYLPDNFTFDDFRKLDIEKTAGIQSFFQVEPTIADDIKEGALYAIIGSLLVVFLYILLRFRGWAFSAGAVFAVFHDVILVLGIFSLFYGKLGFSLEIGQEFIAAMLTVIGYSLNDTVVVFDRIREFIKEHSSLPFNNLIDKALSSTLSRTINTSLTTFFVLLVIFLFGGASIKGFMFALIIGVIVGTYSSLFIATPFMYDAIKKKFKATKNLE